MPEGLGSGKHRTWRRVICGAVFCMLPMASFASDCAPEPQGDGRVAAIIDARTLRLDDGRELRLAGLAALRGAQAEVAERALTTMALGREISLHAGNDVPDRYGRQHAWVFAAGETLPLQATLIANGGGLHDIGTDEIDCRGMLKQAENSARETKSGIWQALNPTKNAESPDDISLEIGHLAVVEGQVRSVRQSGGWTYLNFGRRWVDGFAVMVPDRAVTALQAAGITPKGLEGARLRVRGIVSRRGGPRIEVTRAEQIEAIGGGVVAASGKRD